MWRAYVAGFGPQAETDALAGRAREAEAIFAAENGRFPLGSLERSWLLLDLIAGSSPTPLLESAYFANLTALLARRPARAQLGRLVLGLGPGRCGSTTLTHLMASVADCCATHENPPLVYWRPRPAQLAFHLRRFTVLRRYFALVFDAAHWWLHAVPAVMEKHPDTRVIGLRRNPAATVASFLRVKGTGVGSLNHWTVPGLGWWQETPWDPTYPDYPAGAVEEATADSVKAAQIGRYVAEYHAALDGLAARWPDRVLLPRTEALSSRIAQAGIYRFIGAGDGMFEPVRLNVHTIADGAARYWF